MNSPTEPVITETKDTEEASGYHDLITFLAGMIGAILSLGFSWRLDVPPFSLGDPYVLMSTGLLLDLLPAGVMAFGIFLSWKRSNRPRIFMLIGLFLYFSVVSPEIVTSTRDLLQGPQSRGAVVLGNYDCDQFSRAGVEQALSCFELAWLPGEDLKMQRERYLIPDAWISEGRRWASGDCVEAHFLVHSNVLLSVERGDASLCQELREDRSLKSQVR